MIDTRVERFFNSIKNKKVDFLGIGVSHTQLIKLFASKGAIVTACDKRDREQIGELCSELENYGVTLCLGEDYLKHLDGEIIFRTPGMKYYTEELNRARAEGRVVTSEMEVFLELCPCKIFGVTGSDGKTTTTTLISEMLKTEGYTVHLGGNIGRALLPIIEEISPEDIAVVELSSFQLISMRSSPCVSVVTNIEPNHLDIHKDMSEYVEAKKNIFLHQTGFSRTVLNADNEITASFAGTIRGEAMMFSRKKELSYGTYIDKDGYIYVADCDAKTKVMNKDIIRIPGIHNVENYLAAISAVWGYVGIESIATVAKNFGGVEHRIEFVREYLGVRWYNDSIATSPTRTIAGLNSFEQKIIIIAGGYDKKVPFLPLAPKLIEKAKVLILMGNTAQKIEDTVTGFAGFSSEKMKIFHAKDLADAVNIAKENAVSGDVVSLSPACASFDFYPNFEARGNHFKELVGSL